MTMRGWLMVILSGVLAWLIGLALMSLIGCAMKQRRVVLVPGQKVEIKTLFTTYHIEVEPNTLQFDGNFKKHLNYFNVQEHRSLEESIQKSKGGKGE